MLIRNYLESNEKSFQTIFLKYVLQKLGCEEINILSGSFNRQNTTIFRCEFTIKDLRNLKQVEALLPSAVYHIENRFIWIVDEVDLDSVFRKPVSNILKKEFMTVVYGRNIWEREGYSLKTQPSAEMLANFSKLGLIYSPDAYVGNLTLPISSIEKFVEETDLFKKNTLKNEEKESKEFAKKTMSLRNSAAFHTTVFQPQLVETTEKEERAFEDIILTIETVRDQQDKLDSDEYESDIVFFEEMIKYKALHPAKSLQACLNWAKESVYHFHDSILVPSFGYLSHPDFTKIWDDFNRLDGKVTKQA